MFMSILDKYLVQFIFLLVVEVREVEEAVAVDAEVQEDEDDLDNVLCPVLECESNICWYEICFWMFKK